MCNSEKEHLKILLPKKKNLNKEKYGQPSEKGQLQKIISDQGQF